VKTFEYLFSLLLQLIVLVGFSQESINSGGFQAPQFSFSIGQSFVNPNAGDSGSFQEGVQQVYDQSPVTLINEKPASTFTIYPVPARQEFFISPQGEKNTSYNYCIYDLCGRQIMTPLVGQGQIRVSVSGFTAGYYLLEIVYGNQKTIEPILIQ
jgi:hypothetical protein